MIAWPDVPTGEDRVQVYESLHEARIKFGENYGAFVFRIAPAQAQALLDGKVLAIDIGGREYAGFLVIDTGEAQGKPSETRTT